MENETHQSSLWSGGLIAANFIILQNLLSKSSLNSTDSFSVNAFAIAIPILTCNILVNYTRRKSGKAAELKEILFFLAGIFASLLGIGAAFYSFGQITAIMFIASTIIAGCVYLKLTSSL